MARFWPDRGAAVATVLGAALLLAVPAARPSSAAQSTFDLWTGRWNVLVSSTSRHTDSITLDLKRSGGKVLGDAKELNLEGTPSLLAAGGRFDAAPGLLTAAGVSGTVSMTINPRDTYHRFAAEFRSDRGALLGRGFGRREAGSVTQLSLKISPSKAVAHPGETVTFAIDIGSRGPAALDGGGARIDVQLNTAWTHVRVVGPRHVRSCLDAIRLAPQETAVDCLPLALGPSHRHSLMPVRISVDDSLVGSNLRATIKVQDWDDKDGVVVRRVTLIRQIPVRRKPAPPPPPTFNLTGRWIGNDGGLFAVAQSGRKVRWGGRSADGGQTWTHLYSGVLHGRYLVGRFKDVAPGTARNNGDLVLRVVNRSRLVWVAAYGAVHSFPTFTRSWKRCPKAGCPAPAGRPVPFPEPRIVDRIKSLGFQYEAFSVEACDPARSGSCSTSNAQSDLRRRAAEFCTRRGATKVAPENDGRRLGGQAAPYTGEYAASPFSTRLSRTNERWVDPLNGLVGYTLQVTVFSQITCRVS